MNRPLTDEVTTALSVIKTSIHLLETKVSTAEKVLKEQRPDLFEEYRKALDTALLGPLSVNAKILEDIQRRLQDQP